MNQRIVFSIANQVAVDLLGHREMHVRRASMPVVAPSRRVPVRLDGNLRGIDRESTPALFPVKDLTELGSIGVCRRFAIHPARILCVAGYFCCIGIVPVHVIPATFSVATVSVAISPVCFKDTARGFLPYRMPSPRFLGGMLQTECTRSPCGKSSGFYFP